MTAAPSCIKWAPGFTTTGLNEGAAQTPFYQSLPIPKASIGYLVCMIVLAAVVAFLAIYPALRYDVWQAGITYYSGVGTVTPPLLHGRSDVVTNAESIRRFAPQHLELMVAASIAHQASDPKDRPYGTDAVEMVAGLVAPNQSVGIAQLRPGEIEEWVPALAGRSRFDPDVAIRVMAGKLMDTEHYIRSQDIEYGSTSRTSHFMLLALAQNCAKRSQMEWTVDSFFKYGGSWEQMLRDQEHGALWTEQLRLVTLHIDWLILEGWELPEGVDLDVWRQTAFAD
ncbi:MAG TPA: hypothetical protein VLC52_02660 [Anaerolineae bacterium]|nr:hypothetical protein [Anaerolineae bacterium]